MAERKLFVVPVLIAIYANDADEATDEVVRGHDLPNGFIDEAQGAYEMPFAGSGRPITYEQLADPDFSVFVAYGSEYLTNLDAPHASFRPPERKEPPTDDG